MTRDFLLVVQVVNLCLWVALVLTQRAERARAARTLKAYEGLVSAQDRELVALRKTVEILENRAAERHKVEEGAAREIVAILAPVVSDAAIVGRSYGWPDVLRIVRAVAAREDARR